MKFENQNRIYLSIDVFKFWMCLSTTSFIRLKTDWESLFWTMAENGWKAALKKFLKRKIFVRSFEFFSSLTDILRSVSSTNVRHKFDKLLIHFVRLKIPKRLKLPVMKPDRNIQQLNPVQPFVEQENCYEPEFEQNVWQLNERERYRINLECTGEAERLKPTNFSLEFHFKIEIDLQRRRRRAMRGVATSELITKIGWTIPHKKKSVKIMLIKQKNLPAYSPKWNVRLFKMNKFHLKKKTTNFTGRTCVVEKNLKNMKNQCNDRHPEKQFKRQNFVIRRAEKMRKFTKLVKEHPQQTIMLTKPNMKSDKWHKLQRFRWRLCRYNSKFD